MFTALEAVRIYAGEQMWRLWCGKQGQSSPHHLVYRSPGAPALGLVEAFGALSWGFVRINDIVMTEAWTAVWKCG